LYQKLPILRVFWAVSTYFYTNTHKLSKW